MSSLRETFLPLFAAPLTSNFASNLTKVNKLNNWSYIRLAATVHVKGENAGVQRVAQLNTAEDCVCNRFAIWLASGKRARKVGR